MEVRCSLCGRAETIEKWSEAHERMRRGGGPYVCQTCQQRVQHEARDAVRRPKPV